MLRSVDTHEPMTGLNKLRSRWSFLYARKLSIEVLKVTKEKEIRFWMSMLKKLEALEVADARRVQWAGPCGKHSESREPKRRHDHVEGQMKNR